MVCIITPVFNGMNYLDACIQSVLNQNYLYTEHIFIDGGSTDGTLELLASYIEKYPGRIVMISRPGIGPEKSWNIGLKHAKGDIIGWLGADDMFVPGAVFTIVDFFSTHPGACFVFGACETITETGELISTSIPRNFDLNEALNDMCYIPTTSAFYRREVIDTIGYLDDSFHCCDFDYWIRAGKEFHLYRIDALLSRSRFHKNSTSGIIGKRIYPKECYRISRKHGGALISGYCIKYMGSVVIESCRPVLGWLYPSLSPVMKKKVYPVLVRVINIGRK
jgi:glycosyltransferase involved in cell wall biosynthesis